MSRDFSAVCEFGRQSFGNLDFGEHQADRCQCLCELASRIRVQFVGHFANMGGPAKGPKNNISDPEPPRFWVVKAEAARSRTKTYERGFTGQNRGCTTQLMGSAERDSKGKGHRQQESSLKRRKISAAARKRMADAARNRWAEYRAKKACGCA